MGTKKVTVSEVLIESTSYGETFFRAADKKLYFYYGMSPPAAGDTITYEYPPSDPEQDQVYPAYATVPNIAGAKYTEVFFTYDDPETGINERVGYAAYDPKTKVLSIEEPSSWKKKTSNFDGMTYTYYDAILKTNKYSGAALGAIETKYGLDFNGDEIVGDAIANDYGAGIYLTSSGGLYWSPEAESTGAPPSSAAVLLSSDQKFISGLSAAYELLDKAGGKLHARAVTLDKDGVENDAQIAFPVFKAVKNGDPIFASVNLYDINSTSGKYKLTALTKLSDILRHEVLFDADLNNDQTVGDAITIDYGANIYSTASGSLYWSADGESIGSAPGASAKLLSSDPKFTAGLASAYNLLTKAGGQLATRAIALDKDKEENDAQVAFPIFKADKNGDPVFSTLNLYDINSSTGKYKLTSVAKAADVLRYESLFETDFNNDEAVGDAITGDYSGVGIYSTVSGSLFWSPDPESIGSAPSSSAKLLSSDPKFVAGLATAYDALTQIGGQIGRRTIALDKDKVENDVQIAFPIFKASKNGDFVYSSLSLYDINSSTGKYKMTSITKSTDLIKYEDLFGIDFNMN